MTSPRVSIVIPTYNRERTVGAAVQSALDQTYRDFEIIVVDDGSNDGTAEILRRFDGQIRVIRQPNAGASAARNRGIAAGYGDVVAFLDSDDTWSPGKLARQMALLDQLGPEVVCCLCNVSFTQPVFGRLSSFALADLAPRLEEGVWCNPLPVLATRFVLFNQALAVRKSALLEVGLFNPKLRVLEDYELSLRLATLGPWAFVAAPLVQYGPPQGNSLSRWGDSDPALIPKVMVDVLLQLVRTNVVQDPRTLRALRREAGWCATSLRAACWMTSGRRWPSVLGEGLRSVVRLRNSVFRRSPWWPKMEIVATDCYSEGQKAAPRSAFTGPRPSLRLTGPGSAQSPVRFIQP
jgi:hypothetical protein